MDDLDFAGDPNCEHCLQRQVPGIVGWVCVECGGRESVAGVERMAAG